MSNKKIEMNNEQCFNQDTFNRKVSFRTSIYLKEKMNTTHSVMVKYLYNINLSCMSVMTCNSDFARSGWNGPFLSFSNKIFYLPINLDSWKTLKKSSTDQQCDKISFMVAKWHQLYYRANKYIINCNHKR